MKERIIIIGSGRHAKVVAYNLISQCKYEIACFATTDNILETTFMGYPLISSFINFDLSNLNCLKDKFKTNLFHIGFGDMKYRKDVYEFFITNGWEGKTIIHPSAIIAPEVRIGKGVLIEAGCLITPNPIIGDNVIINTGSQVNHDNIIHNHVHIAAGVVTSGSIEIGENSLIDAGVIITMNKKVGSNCIIGAGSIVTKNIPSGKIAYGIPCRVIRDNIL